MPNPRYRLRASTLGVCLTAIAVACVPGTKRPHAPVRSTLDLSLGPPTAASSSDGPLNLVYGSPMGETDQRTEVSLVFNKPMRPLGTSSDGKDVPVRMFPPVDGTWQWLGSSALRFNPLSQLPLATKFRVVVPAGTQALDESKLEEPYELAFTTPRPRLSSTYPERAAKDLPLDSTFELGFNQSLPEGECERVVSLHAGSTPVEVDIEEHPSSCKLKPKKPLPWGTSLTLRVDAGLRGYEGDLPAGKAEELTFTTRGPLQASFACEPHPTEKARCDASNSIRLEFTSPVRPSKVRANLRIMPQPADLSIEPDYDDGPEQQLELRGEFKPDTQYTVNLRTGRGPTRIIDEEGLSLASNVSASFHYGNFNPSVHLGASGTYWRSSERHILPLSIVNALDVEVQASKLEHSDLLRLLVDSNWKPPSFGPATKLPSGKLNESYRTSFLVEDLINDPRPRGPVLVRWSYTPQGQGERKQEDRWFQLTDIGLVSRVGVENGVVWATDIDAAADLTGTTTELFGIPGNEREPARKLGEAKTDGQGIAAFDLESSPGDFSRLAIVARRQGDWAYQTISAPNPPRPTGFVFDERGIYRPGERVHLSGVLRIPTQAGLKIPVGKSVKLSVESPKGPLHDWTVPLSRFGTFSSILVIPKTASLGRYVVQAELDGALLRDSFRVDEYRPVESTVDVFTGHEAYRRGEAFECTVKGTYLHGGPMAGANTHIELERGRGWYRVPKLEDYTIDDPDLEVKEQRILTRTTKLDGTGSYELPLKIALPGQQTTESITCAAEVSDLNRNVLGGRASAIVHPGDVYVALQQPKQYSFKPGDRVTARTLVVTPEGERRSLPVHVQLIHRTRDQEGKSTDKVVSTCDVTPGATPGVCTFFVPQAKPGPTDEVVVRASAKDKNGTELRAAFSIGIEPPPAPHQAYVPPVRQPVRHFLEMDVEERQFDVGDTAIVNIRSPHSKETKALFTVEREGVLVKRMLTLPPRTQGPLRVELPITDAMIPWVGLNVVVLSGPASESTSGYIGVKLDSHALDVDILLPHETKPGAEVDVDVVVRDAGGKPARGEVMLWAADEGSLYLAGYRRPDALEEMYDGMPVLVRGGDSRDALVKTFVFGSHRVRPPSVRMGSTSMEPRRGDFRQTVFFAPQLETDSSGRLRKRVKLPDGLTTYRFMAVAVSGDDRFGTDAATIKTHQPLMARPSLPRVIRAGDSFEASVIVSTKDLPPTDVVVDVQADGLVSTGSGRRTVHLDPERPAEVRVPFEARSAGPVKLKVDAHAPREKKRDSVDIDSEVVVPLFFEYAAIHGQTSKPTAEAIADLSSIRPDAGSLEISLAATPLAGVSWGFEQLLEYPYGCTEQRVSRLVALAMAHGLATSLGVELPKGTLPAPGSNQEATGALARSLRKEVQSITQHQRGDGGFGFWPESSSSSPWLTAYTLWGLTQVRQRGIAVPENTIRRARTFLLGRPFPEPDDPLEGEELAIQAFTVDILASDEQPFERRADKLFDRRDKLPPFGKALLLHAFAAGSDNKNRPRIDALARELEATIRLDGATASVVVQPGSLHPSVLHASTGATAMVLRGLLVAEPDHPLIVPLVKGLLSQRKHGRYRTTHDAAWALIALDDYRQKHLSSPRPFSARVFFGDDQLASRQFGADDWGRSTTTRVPMARLTSGAGPLTFDVTDGELHYEAQLRFARRQLPSKPIEAGFFVQKTLVPVSAFGGSGNMNGATEDSFAPGQVVLCEVQVVTPSPRQYVVIDDPVPGGLTPVDFGLQMGGDWFTKLVRGSDFTAREFRDGRVLFFVDELPAGISTYRYLARATSVGRFVMPPTRVEEMYVPETFGTTGAGWVRVGR